MKKQIILSITGVIIISLFLVILVNKNSEKYIMHNGIMLAMVLDGKNIIEMPSGTNYNVKIECENGLGRWDVENWKLQVSKITGNVKCKLNFTTLTDDFKLNNAIKNLNKQSEDNQGLCSNEDYTNQNDCENNNEFWYYISNIKSGVFDDVLLTNTSIISRSSSNYSEIIQGTSYGFVEEGTNDGTWKSTNEAISNSESKITFIPKDNSGYQICYKISSEDGYDYAYVNINNTNLLQVSGESSTSFTCKSLGNLSPNDKIDVYYVKDPATDSGTDNFIFYLEKGTYTGSGIQYEDLAGIRYSGKYPNNFIWFNDELWRIIGLVPTCTEASSGTCSKWENLVKIVRYEALSGLSFDGKETGYVGLWESNTLYTLLNNYYYGALNGTETSYCRGYTLAVSNCDYTVKGIDPNSKYGKMVKNVYWNIGENSTSVSASKAYKNEILKVTNNKANVGLMTASDFGYAASGNAVGYDITRMNKYGVKEITDYNWLGDKHEWTMTPLTGGDDAIMLWWNLTYSDPFRGYDVRPVVYLDSNVYLRSGSGYEDDPFIIS